MKSLHPEMQPYSAVVLGSTGNVGRQIVSLLVANPAVQRVVLLNRRQAGGFAGASKVREIVVPDMSTLAEATAAAAREIGATAGFCAFGVGKGTRQMSEGEMRKIEVQYPTAFAAGCKAGGVLSLGLMTAVGADVGSSVRYLRIIGEKEQAVTAVGLPALGIYKPSVILGNSNTPSYMHYVYPAVQWALPSRFHAIDAHDLARAIVEGTQRSLTQLNQPPAHGRALPGPELKSYEYADMETLFSKNAPAA
jgi:uncharacterized protein YbjT (DUF2867 family)